MTSLVVHILLATKWYTPDALLWYDLQFQNMIINNGYLHSLDDAAVVEYV